MMVLVVRQSALKSKVVGSSSTLAAKNRERNQQNFGHKLMTLKKFEHGMNLSNTF